MATRSKASRQVRLLAMLMLGCGWQMAASAAEASAANSPRQASRLKLATFFYHDLDHGREVGTSSIRIRQAADTGNYEFSSDAAFETTFSGFSSQHWQAVSKGGFEPLSASLSFKGTSDYAPLFKLVYDRGMVNGFVMRSSDGSPPVKHWVRKRVPTDVVDQRIDWAAAISGELIPGHQTQFSVFDPITGVSRVVALVGVSEMVRTPAGIFSAFRITYDVTKLNKLERYVVFAAAEPIRMMIREEFPNGVVTELVRIAE